MAYGEYDPITDEAGCPIMLGKGSFGKVYLVRKARLDRRYALKLLGHEHLGQDSSARTRFLREVSTFAALHHPNIVNIADYGECAEGIFYVMDYCEGGSLETLVRQHRPLPVILTLRLLDKAAAALEYAYSKGIIHRDIKPDNLLLLCPPEREADLPDLVRLIDFGLAKDVTDASAGPEGSVRLTQESQVLGTPLYMSPEQLAGSQVDHRADIFSLGITAWYLLAGPPAFAHLHNGTLIRQDRFSPLSYKSKLPGHLTGRAREVIARMIEKEQDRRPQDYRQLREGLKAALAEEESLQYQHPGSVAERGRGFPPLPVPPGMSGVPDRYPAGNADRWPGSGPDGPQREAGPGPFSSLVAASMPPLPPLPEPAVRAVSFPGRPANDFRYQGVVRTGPDPGSGGDLHTAFCEGRPVHLVTVPLERAPALSRLVGRLDVAERPPQLAAYHRATFSTTHPDFPGVCVCTTVPVSGPDLLGILRRRRRTTLEEARELLLQIAEVMDFARPREIRLLFNLTDIRLPGLPEHPDTALFSSAGLRMQPAIVEPVPDAGNTPGGHTLAATLAAGGEPAGSGVPTHRDFAALIYRVLAGREVEAGAFHSARHYKGISTLQAKTDAILRDTLSGTQPPQSCRAFLLTLCSCEGIRLPERVLPSAPPLPPAVEDPGPGGHPAGAGAGEKRPGPELFPPAAAGMGSGYAAYAGSMTGSGMASGSATGSGAGAGFSRSGTWDGPAVAGFPASAWPAAVPSAGTSALTAGTGTLTLDDLLAEPPLWRNLPNAARRQLLSCLRDTWDLRADIDRDHSLAACYSTRTHTQIQQTRNPLKEAEEAARDIEGCRRTLQDCYSRATLALHQIRSSVDPAQADILKKDVYGLLEIAEHARQDAEAHFALMEELPGRRAGVLHAAEAVEAEARDLLEKAETPLPRVPLILLDGTTRIQCDEVEQEKTAIARTAAGATPLMAATAADSLHAAENLVTSARADLEGARARWERLNPSLAHLTAQLNHLQTAWSTLDQERARCLEEIRSLQKAARFSADAAGRFARDTGALAARHGLTDAPECLAVASAAAHAAALLRKIGDLHAETARQTTPFHLQPLLDQAEAARTEAAAAATEAGAAQRAFNRRMARRSPAALSIAAPVPPVAEPELDCFPPIPPPLSDSGALVSHPATLSPEPAGEPAEEPSESAAEPCGPAAELSRSAAVPFEPAMPASGTATPASAPSSAPATPPPAPAGPAVSDAQPPPRMPIMTPLPANVRPLLPAGPSGIGSRRNAQRLFMLFLAGLLAVIAWFVWRQGNPERPVLLPGSGKPAGPDGSPTGPAADRGEPAVPMDSGRNPEPVPEVSGAPPGETPAGPARPAERSEEPSARRDGAGAAAEEGGPSAGPPARPGQEESPAPAPAPPRLPETLTFVVVFPESGVILTHGAVSLPVKSGQSVTVSALGDPDPARPLRLTASARGYGTVDLPLIQPGSTGQGLSIMLSPQP